MEPNIIYNLPSEEYHAHPAISKSRLDKIHQSPAHYREDLLNPKPPTDAMRWGTMFHTMILEPDVFMAKYAVLPEGLDRRTKEGKEVWANWLAENEGKEGVEKPTMAELTKMRDAIMLHSKLKGVFEGGIAESSVFWPVETSCGIVECRARPDYITANRLVLDLKTCTDARSDAFSRSCWNYRYHVQNAFYTDGYRAVFGDEPEGFLFVAIEKTPPYAVALYLANEEMTEQGRREYRVDLETYAKCVESDCWPGYPEEVMSIMLPRWAQEVY